MEVICIGTTNLTDPEKKLLRLHPRMAINPKLDKFDLDCATESLNCKLRWELNSWEQHDQDCRDGLEALKWSELQEEEKRQRALEEANFRQIFNPLEGTLNFSKKRITDSDFNVSIRLPGEMTPEA